LALSTNGFRPGNILAVLFDLDGTLRFNQPSSSELLFNFLAQKGCTVSGQQQRTLQRWTHYYWAQSPELLQDLEEFQYREEAFWINFNYRSLLALDFDEAAARSLAPEVHAYMNAQAAPNNWVPPETVATLSSLRQAGLRLAVLSNRREPCDDELETLGLLSFMDFALVAGQVSYWKPQPEIFHHAVERLQISPSEVLYVGDNYYADVVGARRAGLQPVLIDPDGVFPEADCPVIASVSELSSLLQIPA